MSNPPAVRRRLASFGMDRCTHFYKLDAADSGVSLCLFFPTGDDTLFGVLSIRDELKDGQTTSFIHLTLFARQYPNPDIELDAFLDYVNFKLSDGERPHPLPLTPIGPVMHPAYDFPPRGENEQPYKVLERHAVKAL